MPSKDRHKGLRVPNTAKGALASKPHTAWEQTPRLAIVPATHAGALPSRKPPRPVHSDPPRPLIPAARPQSPRLRVPRVGGSCGDLFDGSAGSCGDHFEDSASLWPQRFQDRASSPSGWTWGASPHTHSFLPSSINPHHSPLAVSPAGPVRKGCKGRNKGHSAFPPGAGLAECDKPSRGTEVMAPPRHGAPCSSSSVIAGDSETGGRSIGQTVTRLRFFSWVRMVTH